MDRKKLIAAVFSTVLICLSFVLPVSAFKSMGEPVTADFSSDPTDTEKTFSKPRAAALTAGSVQWKLTDSSESVQSGDGLTVTKGFLSLAKDNPVNAAEGFTLDVVYSTQYPDAAADGTAAFLYTSDAAYNTLMLFNASSSLIGIAENGDVYYKGTKINHRDGADEADVLNAKSKAIAPGEECTLTVRYTDGKLSVSLKHGDTARVLVDGYACAVAGLRQLQIGADRSGDKRQDNVTYKKVCFSVYGDYVPVTETGLVALVMEDGAIHEYQTASAAVNGALGFAAQGKTTVLELHADITTDAVTVRQGTDLTVDLNGCVLDRGQSGVSSETGYVFLLEKNAALKIIDSAPDRSRDGSPVRGGVITGGAGDGVGGGFQLLENSSLTMTGGSVMNCVSDDHGAAIRVKGGGVKIMLNGVGFYSNFTYDSADNCHGGAIYGDDGCRITMTDCTFEGNYSEDDGGAVYISGGTVEAQGCLFIGNKCLDNGGAVFLDSGTFALFDRCTFYDNRADGDGGAVYCGSDDGTRLSGIFRYNSCGGSGGAVFVDSDGVFLTDAEITDNTAGKHGGGVCVDELNDVSVQGLMKVRNNFNSSGSPDDLYLAHVLFTEATVYDGGLYEGSEIYVGMTDANHTVAELISSYQTRFFFSDADQKTLVFSPDSTKTENQMLITSAIGAGNLLFIGVCCAAAAAAVICVIVIGKKNEKEKKDKTEKEEEKGAER